MNIKRVTWISGIIIALILFSGLQGWTQSQSGPNAPVIKQAFTVEKIKYGDILKIYIEAEAPQGEMLKIATVVDQAGFGRYPTSWVYLKSANTKYFKGYLQWNTFSSKTSYLPEWTSITLSVSVLDKLGNESNVFSFPVTFESGVKRVTSYELPSPFEKSDVRRLGFIDIDLMDYSVIRGD